MFFVFVFDIWHIIALVSRVYIINHRGSYLACSKNNLKQKKTVEVGNQLQLRKY